MEKSSEAASEIKGTADQLWKNADVEPSGERNLEFGKVYVKAEMP